MDDEDYSYQAMQEPLYRVETGNYEYRLLYHNPVSNANAEKKINSQSLEDTQVATSGTFCKNTLWNEHLSKFSRI